MDENQNISLCIKNSTSVLPSMRNRDLSVQVIESGTNVANLSAVNLNLNKNRKFMQKGFTKLDTSVSLTIRS